MNENSLTQLTTIFDSYEEVKLVYFFGSQASGTPGPLSDYDFAVYFDLIDKKKMYNLKLRLLGNISRVLQTDSIDLVIINTAESPELKYHIIKEGKLIFEKEPFKVLVEPRVLNEYFDFHLSLKKYNLTKA
jgi:predicted nucleotidyltransferase